MISVIIPAYNAAATLDKCIQACMDQTHGDFEVIVVDDGSTDDTARIAARYPIHYLRQENRGPAAARNAGAAIARGEFLAFTDADCVPAPDWLAVLSAAFEKSGIAAAGGAYDMANADKLLARMVHEEIAARHDVMNNGGKLVEVDFLGSFNVAVRAVAFREVSGFDEGFRYASAEDNDLAYRLQDAGHTLAFVPAAKVAHHHPERLWPYLRTQAKHGYWRVRLYKKHWRRTRGGDKYAGMSDLLRPPLALLSLALLAMTLMHAPAATALMASLLAIAVLAVPISVLVCIRTKDRAGLLLFPAVVILRDYARGLGMARGFWHFIVRGNA